MKEESKIVELLAGLLQRSDRHEDILEKLVEGQNKTNLALNELRLSNMRIVEVLENNLKLEDRVKKLEKTVFKKS